MSARDATKLSSRVLPAAGLFCNSILFSLFLSRYRSALDASSSESLSQDSILFLNLPVASSTLEACCSASVDSFAPVAADGDGTLCRQQKKSNRDYIMEVRNL